MRPSLAVLAATMAVTGHLGFSAAEVTWHAMGLTHGTAIPGTVAAEVARTAPRDISGILALAPFGRPAEPTQTETDAKPQAPLKLVLHGVVVADPSAGSIAYIAHSGKPAEAFRIDDVVAPGAVLRAVKAEHVVLELGSLRQILRFPDAEGPMATDTRPRLLAARQQSLPQQGSTPDEVIDFWRRRIEANPQSVLDQLGLEATGDGYRIADSTHPGVRRAGFRPGDVVARVNGQQIGDVNADRRLYDQIAASGRARVELIRNGQPIVLTFPLK